MPRRVDHQERRTEIVDAMLRVAVRDGLEAATIRNVAAEAGCSTRPVQYFFADKAELLAAGHARVSERMATQLRKAVRRLGADPAPRDIVEAMVKAFLPTTAEARQSMILYYSFYAAELTDERNRIRGARNVPNGLADLIAKEVERHHEAHGLRLELDVRKETLLLVLALPSIVSGVIAGYFSLKEARALIDHMLDRLLPRP